MVLRVLADGMAGYLLHRPVLKVSTPAQGLGLIVSQSLMAGVYAGGEFSELEDEPASDPTGFEDLVGVGCLRGGEGPGVAPG